MTASAVAHAAVTRGAGPSFASSASGAGGYRVIGRIIGLERSSSAGVVGDDRRRYARFYYERFRAEYPEIYRNSATLGDFLKLIVESELAWPNHPEVPGSVRKSSIATFLEVGLIRIVGYGYELRGFTAERQRRTDKAKDAADRRWGASGNASGNAPSMLGADAGHASGTAQNVPKTKKKDEEEEDEYLEAEQGVRATNGRARDGLVQPVEEAV